MRKWICCAILLILACAQPTTSRAYSQYAPPHSHAERGKHVTVIKVYPTGYYGPLKGQKKYAHGSYRKEVKINGSGKVTSSGVPPTIGTIAADIRHYPYGTIFLIRDKNLVVTVRDTGKDIKGNRIDVFCGWGDKGREATHSWDVDSPVILEVLYMPQKNKRG